MALYAIGDVQGCHAALEDLLAQVAFDPEHDTLWLAGDLVARGPDSLAVLRLVRDLGGAAETVLGNHDLHLLAVHYGIAQAKPKDRTRPILDAEDRLELMHWLRHRPLLLEDQARGIVLTHAGIPPCWSQDTARQLAREVEAELQGPGIANFLMHMYGNEPACWSDSLTGMTRLRVITNHFTRMRLLHEADGALDLAFKEELETAPPGLRAWFEFPNPGITAERVLFGHWAALGGRTGNPRFVGLDTGCVWGGHLTAYRVDDAQIFTSRHGCPSH